jgi:peroxiredoxin
MHKSLILVGLITAFFAALPARAFSLSGESLINGKSVSISTEGKKGIVAVFLSAQCPCSHSHVPILKAMAAAHPDFAFVAVHANSDEKAEASKKYFTAQNIPFPVIQDTSQKLANEYKAMKTPHAYVLGKDGAVLYKGGMTNSANGPSATKAYLENALRDIEAGKAVSEPATRTLGCAISRG